MLLALKFAVLASNRRQREVAAVAGIDEGRLSQIIRQRVIATQRERASLAAALNVPVEALFRDDGRR